MALVGGYQVIPALLSLSYSLEERESFLSPSVGVLFSLF